MDIKSSRAAPLANALLVIGLLLPASQAVAAEYWLCAKAGTVTMPDSAVVPIWGYVQDDNANLADGCPALDSATWMPTRPALTVAPPDTTLTIHLRNELPEPTSIVIPGQTATMVPVWGDGSSGSRFANPAAPTAAELAKRVRSFTHEAPAMAGTTAGTADYTWNNVRPGTYLYHSGTHPQVQVQMGLYGALTRNFASGPNQAYDGVPYDAEVTLLFSEMDPAQHAAIAAGTYGNVATPTACQDTTGVPMPMTSTLCYKPKYFLINGKPFQPGAQPLASLVQAQATLLRLLNAGNRAYVPMLQGMHMKMIAEDGNRYQYREGAVFSPRDQYQYSTWLAALKTTDAIVVPTADGSYPIYDRRLNTVTAGSQDGGIFGVLAVGAGATAFDASITKTDGLASVIAGQPVTYTIIVSSPSAVSGATVSDTMPAELTGVTWTCSATAGSVCPASGAGNIGASVNLAAGGSATFVVHATVSPAAVGTLTNTATVALVETDPNPANNTATDSTTILPPNADLAVTNTDNLTQVVAGNPVQYTIVASNVGPAPVAGAMVSDAIPAALTGATWTCAATIGSSCSTTGGTGDIAAPVNLAVNGSATFTVNATVSVSATPGTLANTATIALPTGMTDPVPANNSATDTTTILAPQADLGITKTDNRLDVYAGSAITYTIVASNAGPVAVTGATVSDTMPADLTGVTWTCVATPGSVCPANGAGSINTPVTLAVNGNATFTVNGMVGVAATGTLSNTAAIAPPVSITDPVPGNNSATDTTTILAAQADLSITKTDGVGNVLAGGPVKYTIVVGNAGPSAAAGASVVDTMPAALTNASWNCVASAGSSCGLAGGSGDIGTTVSLAVGGTATFTVNATVAAGASGSLANTATVTAPATVADPNTANNSATDTDTISAAPTVVAYFSTTGNTAVPGVAAPYDDADIYARMSDGTYSRVFDASVAGVPGGANVDAFRYLAPDDVYLSFNNNGGVNLPGLAGVQDEDIVHWDGATWSMYFDGSDVGLGNGGNAEDVDAFTLLPDGLLISTTGTPAVPGVGGLTAHDLLFCTPGTVGDTTTCQPWAMYFDGSDIGLTTTSENIRFVKVAANGDILLGTSFAASTSFSVTSGANSLPGTGNQVFACTAPVTGTTSACGGFSTVLTLPTLPTGSMDAIDLP